MAMDEEQTAVLEEDEAHPPSPTGALDDVGSIPASSPGPIQDKELEKAVPPPVLTASPVILLEEPQPEVVSSPPRSDPATHAVEE